jgi:anti-sigma factor RsiW
MTERPHFDLELQDLLDARLGPAEEARVRTHVNECAQCRSELEQLRRGRDFARSLSATELSADLLADVVRQLDSAAPRERRRAISRRRLVLYGLSAAAAGLFAAIYARRGRDLPGEVIETFERFKTGRGSLDLTTSDPVRLEQFFQNRLAFHTRVFDLGMMGYSLIGGRIGSLAGRPTASYVYAGPDGRRLQCQMYLGTTAELPSPSERRVDKGTTFLIYSRNAFLGSAVSGSAHTAVFWSEGDVVCVLVSDVPAEDTIALAIAKAAKT